MNVESKQAAFDQFDDYDNLAHKKVQDQLVKFGFFFDESDIDPDILLEVLDKDMDGNFSLEDFIHSVPMVSRPDKQDDEGQDDISSHYSYVSQEAFKNKRNMDNYEF